MKAIVELTKEEFEKYSNMNANLRDIIKKHGFNNLLSYSKSNGCAHYTSRGTYTDVLVEALGRHPSPEEIIMLVDGGFSHFGASCSVNTQYKTFSSRVNID